VAGALCFLAYGIDPDQPENLYLGVVLTVVVLFTSSFATYQGMDHAWGAWVHESGSDMCVCVCVCVILELKSQAVMSGFLSMLPQRCHVIRDGQVFEVEAAALVTGDVVRLKQGEKVPADVRVLISSSFKVDNSPLTVR